MEEENELKRKSEDKDTTDQPKGTKFKRFKCRGKGSKNSRDSGKPTSFRPGNDFSWWSKIQELIKDAANYKCNYVAGDTIDPVSFPLTPVGVMQVNLSPTYGNSTMPTDPLNVWARDLYLRMFQKYRPASGYSASDLGITLIAAVELVKIIATYERIYGIISRYSKLNLNMPFTEIDALGITQAQAAYLRGHLSDFRYDINELIRRAQRVCLPKDISLIANAISLYGYEYLDHESARSQIIIFRTTHFGIYDETDLTAGNVRFDKVDYSQLFDFTAENMCVYLENAVNALVGSDSVQRIFADLVVWFKEDAMLTVLPVPEDYMVVPAYSESILHKLHNAESLFFENADIISGAVVGLDPADKTAIQQSYRVYQCNDAIVSAFSVTILGANPGVTSYRGVEYVLDQYPGLGYFTNHLLDTYHEEMTEETVTEGALWKATFTPLFEDAFRGFACINCAFELVRGFKLFTANAIAPTVIPLNVRDVDADAVAVSGNLSCIDWAPLSYKVSNAYTDVFDKLYGDYDNIVVIPGGGLGKIHRAVILSGLHTDVRPVGI